jgi:mannobiose 2-epimerase
MDKASSIQIGVLKRELKRELIRNILPFWLNHTIDHAQGGFLGHIDFHGNPVPDANKGAILNARILWTFAASYRELGDPAYLRAAERAFDYFMENFVDRKYGGVFWELDFQGKPVNTKKQIYAQAFAIYGLSEYYRATGSKVALDQAIALYHHIELHSFDKERNGYFEAFSRDWGMAEDMRLSEKDQNERKTMNTHLHILEAYTNLYRVWEDRQLKQQLVNLVELFIEYFINSEGHLNLFFDDDWNLRSDLISFGHDIECSWLLQEAAEVAGDNRSMEKCRELAVFIAEQNQSGLDKDGGLYYEYFLSEDRWDRDRHWWPQAEAIVGYYNAWQVSGREA